MSDDAVATNTDRIRELRQEIAAIDDKLNSPNLGMSQAEKAGLTNQKMQLANDLASLVQNPEFIADVDSDYRIPVFFYLGAVLEAISFSLGTPPKEILGSSTPHRYLNFRYGRLYGENEEEPFKYKLTETLPESVKNSNEDLKNLIDEERVIVSTFELPVPFDGVVDILNDLETNKELSIMALLKEIFALCKTVIPTIDLNASFDREGGIIHVFHANITTMETTASDAISKFDINLDEFLTSQAPTFVLNYGSSNSLVENLSVNARVDPAYFSAFRTEGGGANSVDLFEFIKNDDQLRDDLKSFLLTDKYRGAVASNAVVSGITLPIRSSDKFKNYSTAITDPENRENIIDIVFNDFQDTDQNKIYKKSIVSWLSSVISLDDNYRMNLTNKLVTQNRNLAQKLISSYLLEVEAAIHGTVGMSNYDHVLLKNYIPGIGGFYILTGVDDFITPGNFTSNLRLKLIVSNIDN